MGLAQPDLMMREDIYPQIDVPIKTLVDVAVESRGSE